MKLLDCDIKTREVLDWQGVHLFHASSSSCSQKVRIYLNLKGIAWTSHLVDLMGKANLTDYYLASLIREGALAGSTRLSGAA
jgi:hypothetical protein